MIVFDLRCRTGGHRFEGWFASSEDFVQQQEQGLLTCPECGSADIIKAVMAPSIGKKGNQGGMPRSSGKELVSNGAMPPQALEMMKRLAQMQAEALKNSRWVGEDFTENARAMHYGEKDAENIHGQATLEEAKELVEEGINVAPLPFPVAPEKTN